MCGKAGTPAGGQRRPSRAPGGHCRPSRGPKPSPTPSPFSSRQASAIAAGGLSALAGAKACGKAGTPRSIARAIAPTGRARGHASREPRRSPLAAFPRGRGWKTSGEAGRAKGGQGRAEARGPTLRGQCFANLIFRPWECGSGVRTRIENRCDPLHIDAPPPRATGEPLALEGMAGREHPLERVV